MSSNISHNIKKRDNPNDVFITPLELAKKHISFITPREGEIWYDPFKNDGSYYNQFPSENKKWSEILEGKDFFTFDEHVDILCSNPPYSCIDKVIEKSISLQPRVIGLLLGIGNLTARRMEMLENAGYNMTKLHLCKVYKWYGMSACIVWEKSETPSIISYDRVVWK